MLGFSLIFCRRAKGLSQDFVDWLKKHFQDDSAEPQIPPLRYAPVGMTKGTVALRFRSDPGDDEQQVPPLRYAPVGMTKGTVALRFRSDPGDDEQQVPPLRSG